MILCNNQVNPRKSDVDFKRFPSKAKTQMASGQGSNWLIEIPAFLIYVYSALLGYVSTLFLNMFTLLPVTQSVDNLFHSLIIICENEYFLISNIH